jgi:lipid-binding SYLF domain-containing protein
VNNTHSYFRSRKELVMNRLFTTEHMRAIVAAAGVLVLGSGIATGCVAAPAAAHDSRLDAAVWAALNRCEAEKGCQAAVKTAKGVLVFPSVTKADLILGGAGGKGALVQGGKITGYYSIGAGSAGLQAGIDNASQVYAFQNTDALNRLTSGQDWNVGATSGIAVNRNGAAAAATTASVDAFIFDAKGLEAGASVNAFDIWKTGTPRPNV